MLFAKEWIFSLMMEFRENKKQIILNVISSILSFLVGICVSFVLTPFIISRLGKVAYSFYPISTNVTNALTIVSSALNSIATRFVTVSILKGDTKNANHYFSSAFFVDTIISLLLVVFTLFFLLFINSFLTIPAELLVSVRLLFLFVFSSTIVNICSTVFGVATFCKNRIELQSAKEIVCSILRGLLFVVLYFFLPTDLSYIGIVALSISLVNLIFQLIYTKKILPEIKVSFYFTSKKHIKELFISSFWIIVNSLGNILLAGLNLVLLNRFYPTSESSIVSIAMTLPNLISGVITMFASVFYPLMTKRFVDGDNTGLILVIQKSQVVIGGCCCAFVAVFLPLSPSFFELWVPGEDVDTLQLLSFLLLVPYLSVSFFYSITYANTAMNDLKIPALFLLAFGLLNFLVTVILAINKINYLGVLLCFRILEVIWSALFLPLYLSKRLDASLSSFYKIPIKCLCVGVLCFAIVLAMSEFVTLNSWIKFVLFGGICGIFSLFLFFAVFKKDIIDAETK